MKEFLFKPFKKTKRKSKKGSGGSVSKSEAINERTGRLKKGYKYSGGNGRIVKV